jgi:autotransporter-associated beta strand protein
VDNASTAGRTVSILLDDAGILKMAATGSFSGTDAEGNSVTIHQGTLMANSIGIIGTPKTSLGSNGRIQFGESGQTRTATLDYYNAANATTDRVFRIIDNNTAVFKVSGGASTNLSITSGITQSGSASGGGKLTKDGVGSLTLGGNNAHSGLTNIAAGTLKVGHVNGLGTTGTFGSRTTINHGTTLELATDASVAAEWLDIASNATGSIVVNRATAGDGIIHSMGTTYLGRFSTLAASSGANVTGGTATLGISQVIMASGIDSTATLKSDTAAISVGGTVSSGVAFNKTLVLAGSHAESGISGEISDGLGTVSLSKEGAGTWTLSNVNIYTGDTSVTEGTLAIVDGGSIDSSAQIILGTNATLDVSAVSGGFSVGSTGAQSLIGSGAVVGNMTVGANGTLSIGSSPGTMTFDGNLGLDAGSISNFEINDFTPGNFDLALAALVGSQTVTFNGGTLNLLFQSGFNTTGSVGIFDFDDYGGSGFDVVNVSGLASGYSASFDAANGMVTVIPEPGVALLGSLGLLTLLRRRRF